MRGIVQQRQQMGDQPRSDSLRSGFRLPLAHLRHLHTGIAAGVDTQKRRQIHSDIERQAVERAAFTDAQPQRAYFAIADVDARGVGAWVRLNTVFGKGIDDRLLQQRHQFTHAQLAALEVQQDVHYLLSRAVIGYLAAAIALDHRNITGHQQVFRFAGLTLGEDRN